MAPDLPEKLLGIDINDDDRSQRGADAGDDSDEEYIRVVLFRVGDHRLAVPVDDVRTTTDAPEEITPVPRTPDSVEGVTDLRGEITAVIDPSVHFPSADEGAVDDDDEDAGIATLDRDQLLVFDRPGDEQSAAIRVDDINRVASIAESDILDSDAAASRDLSTDAFEHPLVNALVVEEHHPRQRLGQAVVSPESADEDATAEAEETELGTEFDLESASAGSAIGAAAGTPLRTGEDSVSAPGSESSGAEESVAEPEHQSKTIVEVTPLVDTGRLLLAAGPTRRTQ